MTSADQGSSSDGNGMASPAFIRLLLIEDNPADALLARERLTEVHGCAFDMAWAPSLAEGLEIMESKRFDAVVADLNLPDSQGSLTVRQLRQVQRDVPLVVVTGLVDDQIRQEVLDEGAHDIIGKSELASTLLSRSILYVLERTRSEERRRQIETIVSATPEAMLVVDEVGRVRFLNRAADQLVGDFTSSVLGQKIAFAESDGRSSIIVLHNDDGPPIRAEMQVVRIQWAGEPAVLAVIRDLTEREARRAAERKALEAEHSLALFKQVVDCMPIGVLLVRIGADNELTTEWQNPAAAEIVIDDHDDTLRTIVEQLRPSLDDLRSELKPRALPEITLQRQAEAKIYSVQVAPLQTDLVSVFFEDVTERVELEGKLHQAQKMEAIGRLAGGVAHDFNNLLTGIVSFTGFVRDDLEETDPRRSDLDEVLRAADRAATLTRQLLAFSRRQPIAPRSIDLNELVTDMSRMLRRTIHAGVEIVVLPQEDLWPVFVDAGQFEQVVMNLALNAQDAMPDGGKLVMQTKNAPGDPDGVELTVTDTGHGMSSEIQARIFEPFFTTKSVAKGTGLGLSMVYGLVTQAGGKITVQSKPQQGTSFEVWLPRSDRQVQPSSSSSGVGDDLTGSEIILIVEDEPVVRRAICRFLAGFGYEVFEAGNGEEGLRVFETRSGAIDLVLTDVVMPQMTGTEMVREIRSSRDDLPILFMTGYSQEGVVSDNLGAKQQLIGKPFGMKTLLKHVRRLLDTHQPEPSATDHDD